MLAPDKVEQLNGIVQQMAAKNAPASDVQMVVQDFKNKFDTNTPDKAGFLDPFLNAVTAEGQKSLPFNLPNIPGGVLSGIYKSAAGLGQGLLDIGSKALGAIGIGKGNAPQLASPQALQSQSISESLGRTAGDIAQFFIPGGAETKAIRGIDEFVDARKFAERFGPEAGKALSGILKIVGNAVVPAASMGGVTAVQTGGDVNQIKNAVEMGAVAGPLSVVLDKIAPGIVTSLNKADFKLGGSTAAKAEKAATAAAQFETANKILGTNTTKFEKLKNITGQMEQAIQSSAPDLQIPKKMVIDDINQSIASLEKEDPGIYSKAKAQAQEAIDRLNALPGNSIDFETARNAKTSWGSIAFKNSKFAVKDPNYIAEGAYAAELGFDKAINQTMEATGQTIAIPEKLQRYFGGATEMSMKDFNKVYGTAINARQLNFMGQFRKGSTLVGRIFGLWAGSALGEAIMPGSLLAKFGGAGLAEMAATKGVDLTRDIGERVGTAASTIPIAVAKTIQGASNPGIKQ